MISNSSIAISITELTTVLAVRAGACGHVNKQILWCENVWEKQTSGLKLIEYSSINKWEETEDEGMEDYLWFTDRWYM